MSGEEKTFRINIKIDGRNYPLNIDRTDEERYRLAAKFVNETVQKYRELFRNKDSQDILAMAAFQVALNNIELQNQQNDSLFIEGLKDLNDDISDFLQERKKK
ncbi:MAG: cell division protein ZapA [Prolixibacteraceae bacterium]|nr:cell division protein ZapA [Prolixibacteraceae bacterium]